MAYEHIWQKLLSPSEEVKYEFSTSNKQRNLVLIVWTIISLPLFFALGLGLITFLLALWIWYVKKAGYAYAFTNKRVLVHTGVIGNKTLSIDYEKITDVTVIETFTSKWTGSGHLFINTAGTSRQEVILKSIDRPYEVKQKLESLKG